MTDSAFVLGLLGEGKLAGGITLKGEAARNALAPLAEQLGFEVEDVARGVMTITAANMANAIREITIERGQDPRRAKLMAFGGAGPLFGTLLAQELDINEIVIPPYAGNFSAWGLIGSDLTRTAARTRIMKLSGESIEQTKAIATREDVAESLGIDTRRYKVIAFVISAVLASLGGSLMVQFSSFISPDLFNADVTILVFAMLFIGGVATASGPIVGAIVVVTLPAVLTGFERGEALAFQAVLLAILIVYPAGLGVGLLRTGWQLWRRAEGVVRKGPRHV